jgi:uncharacterized membrane protein SpoIIM required for sporulation
VKQETFEQTREARWRRFEEILAALEARQPGDPGFPHLYRMVCQDLALARARGFGASLVDRLNALALRGHQHLYSGRADRIRPVEFLARTFPRAVRREARLVLLVSLLFYGSAALIFVMDLQSPSLIYHLLSADQVADMEWAYDPLAEHHHIARETTGDLQMFAHYVSNNIGISLRTFAWGIFFGIGSIFVVVFNGIYLGVIAAHLTMEGSSSTFYPFLIGHSAFELTAIVLAGVCGLKLGWTLIAPGRDPRKIALRRAAQETVPILYGLILMLVVAAVIEAFWSSTHWVPVPVKFGVGFGLWLWVGAWFGLGGRSRAN